MQNVSAWAERLLMSEPSKVHSLKFAKHPITSHVLGTYWKPFLLMCPFSVLMKCETLTASRTLVVLSNLHDTEGPRGLLTAL